jgi:putative transposase
MVIEKEVLDQLLDGRDPKAIFGKDRLFDTLKKQLSERILNAEMDEHLACEGFGASRQLYRVPALSLG